MPTLEQYSNMLRINKLRLDDELEIQAELQHDIGMEVARLNSRAIEAENGLKITEAHLFIQFKDGPAKKTAEEIKAEVRVHKDRARAWEKAQIARELHEQWSSLLQAWITKGYKLADVGSLYASDYFAMRTISRPDGERRREVSPLEEASRSAMRHANEQHDAAPAVRRRSVL
jgi:hypothetical protein